MTVEQGTLISGLLAFLPALAYFKFKKLRIAAHIVLPLVISAGVYWFPNLGKLFDSTSEYHAWAGLIIISFFPAALAGSLAGGLLSWAARKIISQHQAVI